MDLKTVTGGLYLVADPRVDRDQLLETLKRALEGGVSVLQIWNCWPDSFTETDKERRVNEILEAAFGYDVPVLINEEWELLKTTELDGVHFDEIPGNYGELKSRINRRFIAGITCGNDLNIVRWAGKNGLDYISFCSMFPSRSAGICEIVRPETVQNAREITRLPLFVSGGITPENLTSLAGLGINGVAVISGILNAEAPEQAAGDYRRVLNQL